MKSKRLKVAHVVLNLDVGGLETMVAGLVQGMDSEKFESVVVCLRHAGMLAKELKQMGVTVYVLENSNRVEYKSFLILAEILWKEKVDVVHCHNTAGYFYGGIAALLAGFKRIIYTEHGRVFPDTPRRMLAEKILSFFTEKIVAVSRDMKQCLIKYEKICAEKIQVIHNGIDTDKFHPLGLNARCKMRDALGIAKDDIVIGIVARLDGVKDHRALIRAFALVKRKIEDGIWKMENPLRLLVVGDGPERENIRRIIDDLGLVSCVLCLGARSDIPELLNIMDVFVLSSKNEGISLTLLEAVACGVPIVATRVGGNPEIIKEGKNGLLVNPGDAEDMAEKIYRQIRNPVLSTDEPKSGSLRDMINQYQELYLGKCLLSVIERSL